MIAAHQPTIFGGKIIAALSSIDDGSMRLSDYVDKSAPSNYQKFLEQVGIEPAGATYQLVTYEGGEFRRYQVLHEALGIEEPVVADGLAVNEPGLALYLPLADCTGTILYDPAHKALMVSHLGRHSTEQHGATASVAFMHKQFGTNPAELLVWCSPSPGAQTYPLYSRDHLSLHQANAQDFHDAGILPEHLEISPVDTSRDPGYFSHTDFVNGRRPDDGRFAIVAQLR